MPKEKGGLGVINLRLQNDALLMKHLHKFYNKLDIPWVQLIWFRYYTSKVPHASREVGSFWWKDVLRLNVLYRTIAHCTVGDGSTVCFREDDWSRPILRHAYPRLASYSISEGISVLDVMQTEDLDSLFICRCHNKLYMNLSNYRNTCREYHMMKIPMTSGCQYGVMVMPILRSDSIPMFLKILMLTQFSKKYGGQVAHPESNSLHGLS